MSAPEEKAQKSHRCTICDKTILGSKYNLKSHLYQHGVIQPRFKCSLCTKEYYRRDVYDRHMLAHEGKSKKYYICDHCERSFVDKRNLILHLKVHDDLFITPRSEFKCTACGTVYCEKRLLNYHIRKNHFSMHETEPNFLKKKCNETWVERVKQTEVYVEMTKVHDNVIKIKKCEGNSFGNKTENKSSKMEEYVTNFLLTKDKSQYSKAICDYCKKEMLKKSLKSHIRERHLNIRRFKCEECNEKFSRHYQMVNHICGKYKRRKHKK